MLYLEYIHTYPKLNYIASEHFYHELTSRGMRHHLKKLSIYDGNDLDDWFILLAKDRGSEQLERALADRNKIKRPEGE